MTHTPTPRLKRDGRSRLSSIRFWVLLPATFGAAYANSAETSPASDGKSASVDQRLETVESSLADIQRKLRMLGAAENEWLGGDELWKDPAALLDYVKKLGRERRHVEAYHLLNLLHARFPESEIDRKALRIARDIFRTYYFRTRLHERRNPWVTVEPYALFQWVNAYRSAEDFPELLTSVLRGLPFPFHQAYLDFTDKYYKRDFGWKVEVTDDNGIIDTVTVTPIEGGENGDAE